MYILDNSIEAIIMTIRDSTIAKLQQLPEPLLQEVSDFIDFISQKHLAKTAESQSKEKLVEAWLKWFESVDRSEVTTTESSNKQLRPFGLCAGEFTVPDDFDAPLPEDLINAFEGK
jgi:hypothetical protein